MVSHEMSRRAFIGLSASALAGMVAACTTPTVTPPPQATQAPAATQAAPTAPPATVAPTEQIVLKMMWRTLYMNEQKSMEALFDAFEEANPNYKVDCVFVPGEEFDAKITAWIAAGEPPAYFANIAGPTHRFLASRDQLYDLQPFVDKDNYDLTDFYENALHPLSYYHGKLVGLPSMNLCTMMLYNATMLDEAGLERPPMDWNDKNWNWDTWMDYASKLTKFDDSGKPTQVALPGVGHRIYAMRHWGLEWFDATCMETGFPKCFASDREGVVNTLALWKDLFYKYRYIPQPMDVEGLLAGADDLFATSKLAFTLGTMADFDYYRNIIDFEFSACPIPYPVGRPRWNYQYADQAFIHKPQKDVEASWKLLSFACSADGMKFYPIQGAGAVAPRKSLTEYYKEYFLSRESERHVYTDEELTMCLQANEIQTGAWGHACVEIGRYWSEAILPNYERLIVTNEIEAPEAADNMEAEVNKIIEETTPDWVREWDLWQNACADRT